MTKNNVLRPLARANAFVAAAVIAGSALLPVALLTGNASGDQLTTRFIDMSATQASEGSGRDGGDTAGQDVTYTVSFDLGQDHTNLEGIVIHFCDDSPIVGDACSNASNSGFSLATPTLTANANSGGPSGATDIDPSGWTVGGDNTDYIILSDATGLAGSAGDTVAFDIDGITNPTVNGTFYARITTYTDNTVAAAYTDATAPESSGAYVDEGGIALSVANELTLTARVQEVLEFCIGTETDSTLVPEAADECADIAGTDLSLDVVGGTIATTSNIDTPNDGLAMIRTNALNGASIFYKAELDTGVTGPNGGGTLRQAGSADCTTPLSVADTCFNAVGTTRSAIADNTENFGVALKERITTTGGATDTLRCDAEYAGDGATTCTGAVAGNNYAWDGSGAFDTLASSNGPIDDELVSLEFAAVASPTTPTGLYTVTANFVATSTF